MKKRNNSQIAINSGTGEHETSDIHPLGDNASRVYSEIRESFLDVQNQDIDYLSIINEPIDDQLNHSQAIYYEIPENQSAIGGHLTSGKQDCLHVFFDTSQDTGADKRSYLHPIQLSQIDDDKLDYLHLHHESNSDEERPVYQQLSHYLNSSHEILHTTEMSGTGGDRLDYSSLHLESNSDEERPVYQQLSHDLNSGHEILHTTEMSGTGGDRLDYSSLHYKSNSDKERPIYQQLSHDLNNGCEERVVLHPAYVSLNQLRPAILNVTYVSHNEIGNLGNQCPTDVKHNEQDEI